MCWPIYNQKTSVNEQIEISRDRCSTTKQASALSLLNVHLQAKAVLAPSPLRVGNRPALPETPFSTGEWLKILANVLIWTILFVLPFLLIIGLPIFFIVRAARVVKTKPKLTRRPNNGDVSRRKLSHLLIKKNAVFLRQRFYFNR